MGQGAFSHFPAVPAASHDAVSQGDDAAHRDLALRRSFRRQRQRLAHHLFIHGTTSIFLIIVDILKMVKAKKYPGEDLRGWKIWDEDEL